MARRASRWMWLVALAIAAAPLASAALDLDSAKQSGVIGETTDGYVAAVAADAPADVAALAAKVNAERRATYEQIASKNGAPVDEVGKLAAQKLITRAAPGTWIRDGARWYQKVSP